MKTKTNALLVTVSIVVLVLVFMAGVALYWKMGLLSKTEAEFARNRQMLDSAYSMDPFPSEVNLAKVRENRDELRKQVLSLSSSMGAGQVEPDTDKQPLEWVTMLKNMQKNMQEAATGRRIVTPNNFSFGFERYDEGAPPAVTHVPRLGVQLKVIEGLCTILFDAKVEEVKAVEREVFEAPSPNPTDSRRSQFPVVYDFEHINLEFVAGELAFVQILNNFASNSMFIVVTDVKVEGDASPQFEPSRPAEDVARSAGMVVEEASDMDVYVSGPGKEKPSKIRLELDVYRFLLK